MLNPSLLTITWYGLNNLSNLDVGEFQRANKLWYLVKISDRKSYAFLYSETFQEGNGGDCGNSCG